MAEQAERADENHKNDARVFGKVVHFASDAGNAQETDDFERREERSRRRIRVAFVVEIVDVVEDEVDDVVRQAARIQSNDLLLVFNI